VHSLLVIRILANSVPGQGPVVHRAQYDAGAAVIAFAAGLKNAIGLGCPAWWREDRRLSSVVTLNLVRIPR
jgi:hypothetical protein